MSKDMGVSKNKGLGASRPQADDHATHEPNPSVSALRVGIVDADTVYAAAAWAMKRGASSIACRISFVSEAEALGAAILAVQEVGYEIEGTHTWWEEMPATREDANGLDRAQQLIGEAAYIIAEVRRASRIEARSDQTPQAAEPEGREPDPAKQGDALKPECNHDWRYTGTDYHGSHKGEDCYHCSKCRAWEYRP